MIEAIESRWPVTLGQKEVSYAGLCQRMHDYLAGNGVPPVEFSHVGLVVKESAAAVGYMAERVDPAWEDAETVWAETYGCRIARATTAGIEYEFIEPIEQSFLRGFLAEHGEGVQHLSFQVAGIAECVDKLRRAGARMADPRVRSGLHGSIAFLRPQEFSPLCIELCEPAE